MTIDGWLRSRSTIRATRSTHVLRNVGSSQRLVLYAWASMFASSMTYSPSLVAEIEQTRIVRIVRGADRGDVVAAHREQVVADVVDRDGLASLGMMVVTIHAEEPDRLAVDEELPLADLDRSETDELCVDLGDLAVGVDQFDEHSVAGRPLSGPRVDVVDVERRVDMETGEPHRCGEAVRHRAGDRLRDLLLGERLDGGADLPTLRWVFGAADERVHLQLSGSGDVVVRGIAGDRRDACDGTGFEVAVAVESAHPPLVLVFGVAVCAPLDDDDGEVVLAGRDVVGDVVLAGESTVGAVPGEVAVHVDGVDALGAAEVQHDATTVPLLRHGDLTPVDAGRNPVREVRWRTVERHLDVGVLRAVGVTVLVDDVLHGPVAGHGHLGPCGGRRRLVDRCSGDVVGMIEQPEVPLAVERRAPRSVSGVERIGRPGVGDRGVCSRGRRHRQPPHRRDRRIGPGSDRTNRRKHRAIVSGRTGTDSTNSELTCGNSTRASPKLTPTREPDAAAATS